MKTALVLVAALALSFTAAETQAAPSAMMAKKPAMAAKTAPCKDAAGKFTKCPAAAPAPAVTAGPCKDASGKFTKCPAPATSSMMAKKPAMAAKTGPCKDASGKFTKCPAAKP